MSGFITHYQSANLSDEQVVENFVVRTKEFERVMADIRNTPRGTSFQHYVFVGRRGSGKSTLLRRIQAEVHTDDLLRQRFLVTNLSEEQAGIYKLYDLWDYVLRDLRAQGFEIQELNWQDYQDDLKAYTKALYAQVHDLLRQQEKQLILLVDNIDRIFRNIGQDSSLLREQLMNHNDLLIIGGSTIMAEEFWRYDMPFYQFFSIKRLEALTMDEIRELLEHWAVVRDIPEIAEFIHQYPGKIQVVRMLTDGTPRTMQLFVDMLIDRRNEQGYEYLRRIIDSATPIYQERLLQLSQQQQKIVAELSFFWEAASIEQLVPVCKMKSKDISAQMAQLVKTRIVEKIKGEKKNNYYRLEERFFNLWLLMTQGGPKQKREARYLTVFLEAWYEPEEIQEVYKEIAMKLASGNVKKDYAINIVKALTHSRFIRWNQRDMLLDHVSRLFPMEAFERQDLPETTIATIQNAIVLTLEKGWKEGVQMMNTIEQLDSAVVSLYLLALWFRHPILITTLLALSSNQSLLPTMNKNDWHIGFELIQLFAHSKVAKWDESEGVILSEVLNENSLKEDAFSVLAGIALWAGKMEKFEELWRKISLSREFSVHSFPDFTLEPLLIHKQYRKLLQVFESEDLGELLRSKFMSYYYALLTLINPEDSKLLKMPPEFTQAVNDLVAHIKERQAFFYSNE